MSFSQIVSGGADCGPANPMMGLMKQFNRDRSLQQDHFAPNQRGEGSKSTFGSKGKAPNLHDAQFANEFLREETTAVAGPQDFFDLQDMSHELELIRVQQQHPGAPANWAADFMKQADHPAMFHQPGLAAIGIDAREFDEMEAVFQNASAQATTRGWAQDFKQFEQNYMSNHALHPEEAEAFERAFEQAKIGVNWEQEFATQESWAAEFQAQEANITASDPKEALSKTAGLLIESIEAETNPKFKNSTFLSLMRKLRDNQVVIEGNKVVETRPEDSSWATDFARQRNKGKGKGVSWVDEFQSSAQMRAGPDASMWSSEFSRNMGDDWAEQFNTGVSSVEDDAQDWAAQYAKDEMTTAEMEAAFHKATDLKDWVETYSKNIAHLRNEQDKDWDDLQKDWNRVGTEQGLGYRAHDLAFSTYEFQPNNIYLTDPVAARQSEHRSLADSILALEAQVQFDPKDVQAWHRLGARQQENERDGAAIAALRKAVELDPGMLDAWLALSVSYTNENYRADAYDSLEQWLVNHPKYRNIIEGRTASGKIVGPDRHAFITNMFLEAARSSPGEEMDADIQVGLGVLFNMSEEYDKAVDCFRSALASRPQDYLLWNKMGATLANSRDTANAIEAYYTALEINPSYVRARYNLAMSYLCLYQHREAAEQLLGALALQQGDAQTLAKLAGSETEQKIVPGAMSDYVWDSLKMVMFAMNRDDLANECEQRNLNAFRNQFDF